MKKFIVASLLAIGLAGCTQVKPSVRYICPAPKIYSPDFQLATANEIKQYGNLIPNTVTQVIDWNRMQAELNRCNGVVPNAPVVVKKSSFF